MLILDFNGVRSGVGRCTIEIIQQLENDGIPTLLTGCDEFVHRFPARFAARFSKLRHIQFRSLDRPRFGFHHLRIRHLRKSTGDRGRYSDLLIKLARQKAEALLPKGQRGMLINYPQFTPPPSRERGFAVFIHDLNWRHFPENFPDPAMIDEWCGAWVERAGKVVTNSEFTRMEIIGRFGCAPDKVIAAPLAPFTEPVSGETTDVLARLGLAPGKFFLYPNGWGLHKGFDLLTDAIEAAGDSLPVVVTCGRPVGLPSGIMRLHSSLSQRWNRLIEQKRLVVSDWLTDQELQVLRTRCRAYVLPNRFEGYGFPLAEAIYHYRPAIVSDIPAHREILNRYSQYHLARIFSPSEAGALAMELARPMPESLPIPEGWKQEIEATWSWRHTVGRLVQALGS